MLDAVIVPDAVMPCKLNEVDAPNVTEPFSVVAPLTFKLVKLPAAALVPPITV